MPFESLHTVPRPAKDGLASIGYRRNRNAKGDVRPRLTIGIPLSVANGFKPKDCYALQLGTGKDAGRARIVPVKAGGIVARPMKKGGIIFAFGFVPMLGNDAAEKEFVEVKSIDGGFEISLPEWFKPE